MKKKEETPKWEREERRGIVEAQGEENDTKVYFSDKVLCKYWHYLNEEDNLHHIAPFQIKKNSTQITQYSWLLFEVQVLEYI